MGEKAASGKANVAAAKRVGRPSSYRPAFCDAIMGSAELLAEGATNDAIAAALSVDRATVVRWCAEFEEFAAACAVVKERADDRVETSLFKRGVGYSHEAVKIFMPQGAAAPVYAPYREHYPPDTAAASLWLRNRRPKDWRERVEHTGADGKDLPGPMTIDILDVAKAIGFALALADQRMKASPSKPTKVINPKGEEEPGE